MTVPCRARPVGFIRASADGHLGGARRPAVGNNAAVDAGVQTSLGRSALSSRGSGPAVDSPGRGLSGRAPVNRARGSHFSTSSPHVFLSQILFHGSHPDRCEMATRGPEREGLASGHCGSVARTLRDPGSSGSSGPWGETPTFPIPQSQSPHSVGRSSQWASSSSTCPLILPRQAC